MKVRYFNREIDADSANGVEFEDVTNLRRALLNAGQTSGVFCELFSENDWKLLVGVNVPAAVSCIQYSRSDGAPPYWMAVAPGSSADRPCEFLIGGTATPVPGRFCLPLALGLQIVSDFQHIGGRSEAAPWEEI